MDLRCLYGKHAGHTKETCLKEIRVFVKQIKERSNRTLLIEVYDNGVLGDDNEALEAYGPHCKLSDLCGADGYVLL